MFVCVAAKYDQHLSPSTDVKRSHSSGNETVGEWRCYGSNGVASEQHASVTVNSEDAVDGNSASYLSAELESMLTEVLEVIDCDTDTSTSSAPTSVPSCDLKPTISSAHMTTELLSDEVKVVQFSSNSVPICSAAASPTFVDHSNNDDATGRLSTGESRSPDRRNTLAAAFAAHLLLNQPKKPS